MNVRFAVLADYSNVTQEGKLNILGVFDVIHGTTFPAIHHEMQLVIRFEADISERNQQKDVSVRLINGRGEQLLQLNGRMTVGDPQPGALLFFNHVLTLRDLLFPSAGDYQFDIYIEDRRQSSVPLKVVDMSGSTRGGDVFG